MFWDLLCDLCYTCSFRSHWVLFLLSPTLFGSLILSPPPPWPLSGPRKAWGCPFMTFWCQESLWWVCSLKPSLLESAWQPFLFHAEDIFTRLVSEWASLVARHGCSLLWSSSSQGFQDHLFLPRTQRWLWRQESAVVDRTFLRRSSLCLCFSFPIHDLLQPQYLGPVLGVNIQGLRGQDLTYSLSDLAVLLPAFGCLN